MFDRVRHAMCSGKHRYADRRKAGQAAQRADRYNRVRRQMCGGKKRYDRRHAYMAAQSAGDRSGAAKRVYHCDFCGEYHITHKPKRGDG